MRACIDRAAEVNGCEIIVKTGVIKALVYLCAMGSEMASTV